MLVQLQIENVAIIEKLNISMFDGFNVLTGETGAGKSILIDSLNALLGSRVSRELIRSGVEKATVQGLFSIGNRLDAFLESMGIEPQEDGTILISRVFTDSGKNICRINGSMVTVSALKEIGQRLVDIHGQNDNQSLLRTETHIELLDLFSGEELAVEKDAYQKELELLHEAKARLKALSGEGKGRERTMDMLKFQIDEIERAGLYIGEDKDLEHQSMILSHAEEIISALSSAYQYIKGEDGGDESALDKLGYSMEAMGGIEEFAPQYAEISQILADVNERLTEVSREIRRNRDNMEYDPKLHKSIEERISLIQGLKRKYGETIEDILEFCRDAKRKLDEMERSEEIIFALEKEIKDIEKSLHEKCGKMNGLRTKAAKLLEAGISRELEELEMPRTRFEVSVISCPEEGFNQNGTDRVEFLFSPNVGEALKPLSKIASGGEMSRVMLAVKSILADIDEIPTMVFDEIDSGVSGKAATKVGEKLKRLSKNHQVLCITHHAQIASLADAHYLITKKEQAGRTATFVELLEGGSREDEITRLLSGEHRTEAARRLANELLKQGKSGVHQ